MKYNQDTVMKILNDYVTRSSVLKYGAATLNYFTKKN